MQAAKKQLDNTTATDDASKQAVEWTKAELEQDEEPHISR